MSKPNVDNLLDLVTKTPADLMRQQGMRQSGLTPEELEGLTRKDDHSLASTKKANKKCALWGAFTVVAVIVIAFMWLIYQYLSTLKTKQEIGSVISYLVTVAGTAPATLWFKSLWEQQK